jgi:hypothetical protein
MSSNNCLNDNVGSSNLQRFESRILNMKDKKEGEVRLIMFVPEMYEMSFICFCPVRCYIFETNYMV